MKTKSSQDDFWLEMTSEEFREFQKQRKRSKFGNVPVVQDGIRFSSTAEAAWYYSLVWLQDCGFISFLMPHPVFVLCPAHRDNQGTYHKKLTYVADAIWYDKETGKVMVGECKGAETRTWKDKRKLFTAKYPWLTLQVDYR